MSSATAAPPPATQHPGLGFREFVALIAAMMAANALAIDSMLPALPAIGASLGLADENQRQWIITAYLLGFGVAQIVYGPLSDRYGRKPVLVVALGFYAAIGLAVALADSFTMLIVGRALQGVAAAATRIMAVSIVRDCYSGRTMARVMSLTVIVFLAVPILAPSLGQLILLVAPWRAIFLFLALFGLVTFVWAIVRLPETLHPEYRRPIAVATLAAAFRRVVTTRTAIGYTLTQSAVMGAMFGFINSVQQLFYDTFRAPGLLAPVFAGVAGTMAVASLVNSRIVERLGTRRVSHSALLAFVLVASIHFAVAVTGHETLWTFAVLQACTMGCFGLAMGNFGAMAMEPLGDMAGMASSIQGFLTTVIGSLTGLMIGQHFDGTTVPLTAGFFCAGLVALALVLVTERGRLFRPQVGR